MPFLTTLLAASSIAALPTTCAWDDPGRDPFLGEVPAAVDAYQDIPAPVRARLKERMARHAYDDFVEITRDHIGGTRDYDPGITAMHFGAKGKRCATVTRDSWKPDHREHGLVYCEDEHCILVPTVCRNVSRIVRRPAPPPPVAELEFDPPGAGPVEETGEGVAVWPGMLSPAPGDGGAAPAPAVDDGGGRGGGGRGEPWAPWPGGGGGWVGGIPPTGPTSPAPPPIAAPVSEPGLGLLSALGAGLVFWRRRRR